MSNIKDFRFTSTVALTVCLAALSACSGRAPSADSTVPIPEIRVESPEWDGVGDDRVVATVGDARIPAWRVRDAFVRAAPGADPDDVLYSVMAEELIARQAAGDKGFVPDRMTFEKVIASRYIEKKIVDEFGPDQVPMDMLKEAWAMPQVWAKFNHVDLYEVQDYQWICCADPANCDPAVSEECMKEGEAPMLAVSQSLERDRPDPGDLAILAPEYKKIAYHLTYQEYTFAFDRKAGYQKGATHIDTTLADEIMKLAPGAYTPPVRSKFGWHIARLASHSPEVSGDLNDPGVRREIAEVFIQRFRQDQFLRTLAGLIGKDSLKLLQIYFEKRPAPETTPVYDVKVFHNALRDAAAVQSQQEAEPLPQF